jgi:Ser/Thr protein kinase RdoA (MazF antagonist)
MHTTEKDFRDTLRKLAAMQARVAREGYGRNSRSTGETLTWRYRHLEDLARTDEVLDALDADPRLAARWNAAERRFFGLYV